MAFNVKGLLSGIAGLPNAIGEGLLGPMPVNPGLGIDAQSLSQARQQALSQLAMGLMAGDARNPGATLYNATQGAQEGYRGRIFDMLKEREFVRFSQDRDKKAQDEEASAQQQAAIEAAMANAPPPAGLPIPPEAWAALPAKDKVTLYGQYTPPKPPGPTTVAPGGKLVDPTSGKVIFANPALPRDTTPIQLLMPGQLPDNVPATIRQAVAGNEEIIRKAEETISAHEAYKKKKGGSATGPMRAGSVVTADTLLPGSPGVGLVDLMDPEGVAVRSGVADIGSAVFHDRSGAAVTISESPRLRPFVPEGNKDMDVSNVPNLRRIIDAAREENRVMLGTYGVPYGQKAQQGAPRAGGKNAAGLWVVTSDADYESVPSGEQYEAPDGTIRTKK
jgi:hypothetical protein